MSQEKSYLVPNLVIVVRVILAFLAVGLFLIPSLLAAAMAVVLTVLVIAMDGLDGYLARRLDLTSELGSVLDITADRIVEHIFTPFGSSTLQRSALTRFLTGSRTMRTGYAVAKTAAFVLMGTEVALARAEAVGLTPLSTNASDLLGVGAHVSVWVAVVLCVVRGIPVLMDSRAYLEPAPDGSAAGGGA
jgi:CDP-diacylglycerol--glycerol-3-phosphate 3-phosphatidyltransferase